MTTENFKAIIYPDAVPHFVEEKLEELYQHMYSSYAFHAINGSITKGTHTYVAYKDGEIVAAILFRTEGERGTVLNEQFCLGPEEIQQFCDCVFETYSLLKIIVFPVIETTVERLGFSHLEAPCTQDIVVKLPDTPEAYLASLGKSTRNYVKRYLNKAKRDFPSMSFKSYMQGEASEQMIRAIIELNRKRIEGKNQSSYIDEEETARIIKLVKVCGLIKVITVNEKVCAGTINLRFGKNYFLKVIAHDPAYDAYGLGNLCCYLTICECISQKGMEYHFLWGKYEYKYRFLGIQKDLKTLTIYRSSTSFLMNSGTALKFYYNGCKYRILDWLEGKARRGDSASGLDRWTFLCFNSLKKMKRSILQVRSDSPPALRISKTSHDQ